MSRLFSWNVLVSPTSSLLKGTQQKDGFNEPTDTVVWSAIIEKGIDPYDTLLWNIFPFHPHKEGNPLTNRTPTDREQQVGWEYTKTLVGTTYRIRRYRFSRARSRTKSLLIRWANLVYLPLVCAILQMVELIYIDKDLLRR